MFFIPRDGVVMVEGVEAACITVVMRDIWRVNHSLTGQRQDEDRKQTVLA